MSVQNFNKDEWRKDFLHSLNEGVIIGAYVLEFPNWEIIYEDGTDLTNEAYSNEQNELIFQVIKEEVYK